MGDDQWDVRFIMEARHKAEWSHDPSRKVGAVVTRDRRILSTGFNGFPRGVEDSLTSYNNREFKYRHVVHAEANAIVNAARFGIQLRGGTLYTTWPPCIQCAGMIVNLGLVEVVVDKAALAKIEELNGKWEKGQTDWSYESGAGIQVCWGVGITYRYVDVGL